MADYIANTVLIFTGTPPGAALPFLSSSVSNTGFTFTDSDGLSPVFETTDTITSNFGFPGNHTFAGTATIPLSGSAATVEMPVLTDGTRTLLLLPAGTTTGDYSITNTFNASALNTSNFTACFAKGTEITTLNGFALVEDLAIGDEILGADGAPKLVKWIGRQTVQKLFAGDRAQPVCIRAGALGNGLPTRDLTLTGDHGLVFFSSTREAVREAKNDGYVINASALVNGDTVVWVPMSEVEDSFTVYHIETENHDVILANGARAETFIDAAGRAVFDNHLEYLDLYGAERIIPEMAMPRVTSARLVPQAIKGRLNGTAACTWVETA